MASPWFPIQADLAQTNMVKNKDEHISYFPNFIQTQIDIAYNNDNAYMLLPITTEKFTKLKQTESVELWNLMKDIVMLSAEDTQNGQTKTE